MRPYLKQILSLMFQRLSLSKTTKYICGLIVFLGFYSLRFGPNDLVESLDATQPKCVSDIDRCIILHILLKLRYILQFVRNVLRTDTGSGSSKGHRTHVHQISCVWIHETDLR